MILMLFDPQSSKVLAFVLIKAEQQSSFSRDDWNPGLYLSGFQCRIYGFPTILGKADKKATRSFTR